MYYYDFWIVMAFRNIGKIHKNMGLLHGIDPVNNFQTRKLYSKMRRLKNIWKKSDLSQASQNSLPDTLL
ncbi:hypothetical protein J2T61_001799 [Methanocalculus sp. AMF5]|nr:hypothetical protein [Methanocalculus sp. AMF5]